LIEMSEDGTLIDWLARVSRGGVSPGVVNPALLAPETWEILAKQKVLGLDGKVWITEQSNFIRNFKTEHSKLLMDTIRDARILPFSDPGSFLETVQKNELASKPISADLILENDPSSSSDNIPTCNLVRQNYLKGLYHRIQ
jgi:hypothetical protein